MTSLEISLWTGQTRVQEFTLLAWAHSLHATKTHFRPPPHRETQSHIHVCLPSILCFPGVLWTDPLSPPQPKQLKSQKKKKKSWCLTSRLGVSIKIPSQSQLPKTGSLHLNWHTQGCIIQKKQYCSVLFIFSCAHSGVCTPRSEMNYFFSSLYL